MRVKIATAVLVIIGLFSIYTPIHLSDLRVSPTDEVLVGMDRAECIKSDLPNGLHFFGFLPPVDLIVHSTNGLMEVTDKMRRLFMMRYTLTPDLVSQTPESQWVIASYKDRESGLQSIQGGGWKIVKDCQNGIFLLRR